MSGRKENTYYIDYLGVYKITDISKLSGIEAQTVKEKYIANGADYDETQYVYYFDDVENAKKTIKAIVKEMKSDNKGKLILLSEAEIEYIRKALINEGVNTIHVKNKIKDDIFKKLNG
jgi:ubiquinone biosynthesis protein Coq4